MNREKRLNDATKPTDANIRAQKEPVQSMTEFEAECQPNSNKLAPLQQINDKVDGNGSGSRFDFGFTKKLRRAIVALSARIFHLAHAVLRAASAEPPKVFNSATDYRTVVEIAYRLLLGRAPDSEGLASNVKLLQNGTPLTTVVAAIANSNEAKQLARGKALLFANFETETADQQLSLAIRLVYHRWVGREPDPPALQHHLSLLRHGLTFSDFNVSLANSPEAKELQKGTDVPSTNSQDVAYSSGKRCLSSDDISEVIKLVYRQFLKRDPDPGGASGFFTALENGLPVGKFIDLVANSEEARPSKLGGMTLASLSDGQFILRIAEVLFQGGGANPKQLEIYKGYLREDLSLRSSLVNKLVLEYFSRPVIPNSQGHSPHTCWVMGTGEMLTRERWNDRASQISTNCSDRKRNPRIPLEERTFCHSGKFLVSAIASLYRGGDFIEQFLENITSQTLFDKSELIIIDAESPDGEQEIIEKYQKVYSNIIYKRINYRIGIYDAWNEAIRLSRGSYLTNTNLDDLRRLDSFEIQAAALDEFLFFDVVYQEFFYNFDSHLDFEQVAEFGFKSDLPVVTPNNLLCFNSPHNAPMWRAQLHRDLGEFDTSFKSAGDYEFWLRCILHGKHFFKLNAPHISYFQNPTGISTSPDTKGYEEARRLMKKYAGELISPYMTMSREDLAKQLKITPDWPWEMSTYDVVQRQFRSLRALTT